MTTIRPESFQFMVINRHAENQAIEFKYTSDPDFTIIPIPDLVIPDDDINAEHRILMNKLMEVGQISQAGFSLDQDVIIKGQQDTNT